MGSWLYGQQDLPQDNLQGYYPLNGGTPDDFSGNGYNGTTTGGVLNTSSSNNSGGFYSFGNGYINMGDVDEFEGTSEWSLSFCINTFGTNLGTNQSEEGFVPIISKWSPTGVVSESSFRIYMDGDNLVTEISDGIISDSLTVSLWNLTMSWEGWTIVTITFDNGFLKLYDNRLYSEEKNLAVTSINNSNSGFKLGDWANEYDGNYATFTGGLDEVIIYNKVLSECEHFNFHIDEWTYPLQTNFNMNCDCLYTSNWLVDSWQWVDCTDNFSLISNETNSQYFPQNDGNYASIIVFNNGQCIDTTECFEIINLGIEEPIKNGIGLYPNPTSSILNISIPNLTEPLAYKIINLLGEIIIEGEFTNEETTIDASLFSERTYFIKFPNSDINVQRFVKN
jgi:hypothetical protein